MPSIKAAARERANRTKITQHLFSFLLESSNPCDLQRAAIVSTRSRNRRDMKRYYVCLHMQTYIVSSKSEKQILLW